MLMPYIPGGLVAGGNVTVPAVLDSRVCMAGPPGVKIYWKVVDSLGIKPLAVKETGSPRQTAVAEAWRLLKVGAGFTVYDAVLPVLKLVVQPFTVMDCRVILTIPGWLEAALNVKVPEAEEVPVCEAGPPG